MNQQKNLRVVLALTLLLGSTVILSSCGGGGGTTSATNGMISGTAVKGPVNSATVTAFAINNGTMGAQIGSGITDVQGNFNISIGGYSGSVMLQMSDGTYTDEATNTSMTMHAGDVMTSVIPSVTAGSTMSGVQITPLTSMAQARAHNMVGGMTEANITAANTAVGTYFMVNDILHTAPINPLVQNSGIIPGVDQNMKNYGMAIAAMSQFAKNLSMPFSSGIVTAIMDDASDGIMDGMMGSTPIAMSGMGGMMGGGNMLSTAGTSSLANAMTMFINNASVNKSGLNTSAMNVLINQLNNPSTGPLPGAGGAAVNGMVSGTAVMGPFSGGTVKAFAITNGTMGAQLASGPTDTHGNFTVPLGAYAGPVMLQMSGGTYTDLATGATMTMYSGDVMATVIQSMPTGSTMTGIHITPLTSIAQARAQNMAGGMTEANILAANTAVGNYFTVGDILHTPPIDPLVQNSGTAAGVDQDMRNYGMVLAAMSQEAKDVGMPHSSGMVTAMMDDASDGVMNGYMGSTQISMIGMGGMAGMGGMGGMGGGMMSSTAGTIGLADAMTAFINTSANISGLDTVVMQTLISKLTNSGGTIQ
jgi:hypothetical protein